MVYIKDLITQFALSPQSRSVILQITVLTMTIKYLHTAQSQNYFQLSYFV